MSVYHSIRASMRDVDADDEEIVVLDMALETDHPHPAAERSPTHVSYDFSKKNNIILN